MKKLREKTLTKSWGKSLPRLHGRVYQFLLKQKTIVPGMGGWEKFVQKFVQKELDRTELDCVLQFAVKLS